MSEGNGFHYISEQHPQFEPVKIKRSRTPSEHPLCKDAQDQLLELLGDLKHHDETNAATLKEVLCQDYNDVVNQKPSSQRNYNRRTLAISRLVSNYIKYRQMHEHDEFSRRMIDTTMAEKERAHQAEMKVQRLEGPR